MAIRSLTLLVSFLVLAYLPGCGTDTKTTESLGASTGQSHYGGVWIDGNDNPANRAQYLGYSLVGDVQVGTKTVSVDFEISCESCHPNGDVSANAAILKEYAVTGHADVAAIPWTVPETGTSCQRCHTTFGFLYHLENYNPDETFTGITLSTAAGGQRDEYRKAMQVLICSACHLESGLADGTLRTAGKFSAIWSANSIIARVDFPDAGASNLCIRCHSARRAGVNVTELATTTAHNLPVAAMVYSGSRDLVNVTANTTDPEVAPPVDTPFTGVGYEFPGLVYEAPVPSHRNVGTPGGKGPCVGCHMSSSVGHSLKVLSKDEGGNITTINGSSACLGCHGTVLPAWLNGKKAGFNSAVKELEELLQAKGFFFDSEDGTFYRDADSTPLGTGATSAERNAAIKKYYDDQADSLGFDRAYLRGAAYNLWLLSSRSGDRAAYVHNSNYTKKVLFDTLDYLDNGDFDGDLSFLSATAAAYLDGDSEADGVQRP